MLLFLVNIVMMYSGAVKSLEPVQSAPRESQNDGGTSVLVLYDIPEFVELNEGNKSIQMYLLMKAVKIMVDKQNLAIIELKDVLLSIVFVEVVVVICLISINAFFNLRSFLFLAVLLSKIGVYIEGILQIRGLPHRFLTRIFTSEGKINMWGFLKDIFNIRNFNFLSQPIDLLETSEGAKTKTLKRGLKRKRLSSSKGSSVVYDHRGADVTLGYSTSETEVTTVTGAKKSKSVMASKFVKSGARRKSPVGENRSSRFTSEVCFFVS